MNENDTIAVRSGEELPIDSLSSFLRKTFPEIDVDALVVRQFGAGHSNLTYLVQCGPWEAVLRRPPHGPLPPKAHDMHREYRLLQSLHPHFPLAPKPYVYCEDRSVLGSPFFLMERRQGVVIDRHWPKVFAETEENALAAAQTMVDTLSKLHAVDVYETKIAQIGHPEGYLERQVTGLLNRYQLAKTDDILEAGLVGQWMVDHLPTSPSPTLIHNDFKLNNMLYASDKPDTCAAVVDWEMTTIGDPLSDLAITLSYWCQEDDPDFFRDLLSPVTAKAGFPTRSQLIEMYARQTGRDLGNMNFYLTFAYFKAAVICQQIYYRFKAGQTQDERFAAMGQACTYLIRRAYDTATTGGV